VSAVKSVVWGLRCDSCGFTDYQAGKVAAARRFAFEDGWTQIKPTNEATRARVDLCPECATERSQRESAAREAAMREFQ
jgi:hypothetical protein